MTEQQLFCLGTNNWQALTEFAPGSGILHEGHHHSLNELPTIAGRCYSMWPSPKQKSDPARDDYRVFELPHDIPICESVGPVSSYRWHSMTDDEVNNYRMRLLVEAEKYIDEIEEKNGRPFTLFIAHHCFQNPTILVEINARRVEKGKAKVPIVVFAHGTALKMYQNEIGGGDEYPMRFYSWMQALKTFVPGGDIVGVFAIANAQKDLFKKLFPEFPEDRVAVVSNGYNQRVFRPVPDATIANVLAQFPLVFPEGYDIASLAPEMKAALGITEDAEKKAVVPAAVPDKGYKHLVIFTGRFADWKRIDVVLNAAKKWEAERSDIATVIIGAGALKERVLYTDMAYKELQLHHTYILGPQGQDNIAKLNTVASAGVYPSKDEPFGLVLIECMACGTPAIGAKSGGPLDFVTPEVGHLIDESSDNAVLAASLKSAVVEAIEKDWKGAMGEACKAYAKKGFSLTAQCQKMMDHITENFLVDKSKL